VHVKSWSSK